MPVKISARILSFFLLATAAGCRTNVPATPQGTAYVCGALCGSVVVALGASASPQGVSFFIQSPAGDFPALAFYATLPGTSLQAITYDESNGSGATTVVQEAATGGSQWTQTSGASGSVGSFSLVLTDAGVAVPTDGGTSWPSPQGMLTVTLEPTGTLNDAGLAVAVSFPTNAGWSCQYDAGPSSGLLYCPNGAPIEP